MGRHKIFLSVWCGLALILSACSRQESDWQKARETNTAESYEQFLKKYPTGDFTAQAQARVKELYEERDWQKARDLDTPEAYRAFLKQYPEGKWTEEARIRVENFTLAQAPGTGSSAPGGADPGAAPPDVAEVPGTAAVGSPATESASPTPANETPPTPVPAMHGANAATKPAMKAAPTAVTKAASGTYAVQLGAFKSGAQAAHRRWTHLEKEYPALLAGLSSKVVPKKTAAGNLYRLQAVGLTEKHARSICSDLQAKSQPCLVVPPA